jgi:hypothetical protein
VPADESETSTGEDADSTLGDQADSVNAESSDAVADDNAHSDSVVTESRTETGGGEQSTYA